MPLNKTLLSLDVRALWKQWSYTAFNNMHIIPFPEDIKIEQMQLLTAQGFGTIFSGITPQLATAINSSLMLGIVSTPYGASPPIPIIVDKFASGMQPIFYKWATKAFLDMNKNSFSEKISISQMQKLSSNKFGLTFSSISEDFSTQLCAALTKSGFISLTPAKVALEFKPIFYKWAEKAMSDMHSLQFSDSIKIGEAQRLTANKFADTFSKISVEFADKVINTFKSSKVKVPLGVGNIS